MFLNTIGQDWTLLKFVKEKKWGEREKKVTFITVHNTGPLKGCRKHSNFLGFSETNLWKNWPILREFGRKICDKSRQKTITKKSQFRGNFFSKFHLIAIGFALIS